MSKLYFEVIFTFGKSDGESTENYGVINDTKEEREFLVEQYKWDDEGDSQAFIEGKSNSCFFDNIGGDWDERTGTEITLYTREEIETRLKEEYEKRQERITKLFKEL